MTFIGGCAALGARRRSLQCDHLPFIQALWKWGETKRRETTVPVPTRQQAPSLQDLKLTHSNASAAASITPVSHFQYRWCLTFTFLFLTKRSESTRVDRPLFHRL